MTWGTETLLPCPFCGSPASDPERYGRRFCSNGECPASACYCTDEQWNTRCASVPSGNDLVIEAKLNLFGTADDAEIERRLDILNSKITARPCEISVVDRLQAVSNAINSAYDVDDKHMDLARSLMTELVIDLRTPVPVMSEVDILDDADEEIQASIDSWRG